MNGSFHRAISCMLIRTRLAWLPVKVLRGVAQGAWWSLFPWTSYWRGTHEPALQAAVLALGDIRGWSCWDLGAHYGLYSVALARRVGSIGEVGAFEPNPLSFRRLAYHRRLNRLTQLKLFQMAASDRSESAELYTYGKLESTTTHLRYEGETAQAACRPIIVKSIRLDELVADGRLRLPDLVKIDIEGHAHRAIEGMAETLARKLPVFILAFHGNPEAATVRQILAQWGYRSRPIGHASPEAPVGDFLFTPPG
jgi:FkbM family methyltransferase